MMDNVDLEIYVDMRYLKELEEWSVDPGNNEVYAMAHSMKWDVSYSVLDEKEKVLSLIL